MWSFVGEIAKLQLYIPNNFKKVTVHQVLYIDMNSKFTAVVVLLNRVSRVSSHFIPKLMQLMCTKFELVCTQTTDKFLPDSYPF